MLEGGCLCGFVRYRLTSLPMFVNGCHCRMCQKASGSAFAINAMIEADRVELIGEGEPEIVHPPENLPPGQTGARCPRCGTALWGHHRMFGEGIRFVDKMPSTAWSDATPSEYGFYSNVNPQVDHPRWTQARERRIGEFGRRATLMFNGYGDQVASMYAGMDLKRFY